ncbi:MAG: biopolymer transporter ExbD [Candidatus Omnitrophica bacterium]|nr:biopolymer transporter ExbD [Candidatus Omnitrophota bacterium]
MNIKRHMEIAPPLHPVVGIAFLNFIFVVFLLVIFFSFFAVPSGFELRLPRLGPVGGLNAFDEPYVTVRITSENVLYFNDKVVTINELKRALFKIKAVNKLLYLRVDRRASAGRMADVWDLCKGLEIARVKIVASEE